MLLSRDTTSSLPSILSEDDTEGIPLDTWVYADPAMLLEPVAFQTDSLSPANNAAALASMENPLTSNVSSRQVLSVQYNTMPALSYATHQTPPNALHTTFMSSSFSNAMSHSCTSTPLC